MYILSTSSSTVCGFKHSTFCLSVEQEIRERAEFLEDMKALGREKEYMPIVSTEISQVSIISFHYKKMFAGRINKEFTPFALIFLSKT